MTRKECRRCLRGWLADFTILLACAATITGLPSTSAGQDARATQLTMSQAIERAWSASADARAAQLAVDAAAGRARQADARPNPTLSYGREQTSHAGLSTSQDILAIEQRIELGDSRGARVSAAGSRQHAADARLSSMRSQLAFEAARAYTLAQAARLRLAVAEQGAGIFARAVTISDRQLAAGDASGYANRRIRLEAARYAAIRATEELEARTTTLTLVALVTASTDSIGSMRLELTDSLRAPDGQAVPLDVDSLVDLALRQRGDVRALEYEAAAAQFDAQGARASRVPHPAFTLGFKSERLPGSVTAHGFVLGVAVPLPLWDRKAGEVDATAAESTRRLEELASLRKKVRREVIEAYDAWQAAERALRPLHNELAGSSARSMNAVQVAWTEGEITLVEWLDAIRAFQEAEVAVVGLRAQAFIRRAALELAMGQPGFERPAADSTTRSDQ